MRNASKAAFLELFEYLTAQFRGQYQLTISPQETSGKQKWHKPAVKVSNNDPSGRPEKMSSEQSGGITVSLYLLGPWAKLAANRKIVTELERPSPDRRPAITTIISPFSTTPASSSLCSPIFNISSVDLCLDDKQRFDGPDQR